MSILIKGMEMPKTCEECCLESFCDLWIEAIKMSGVELKVGAKATIRHPDCPLVPVPNHGRLKDYDQIMNEYNEWFSKAESREYEDMFYALCRAISDSRTIIPGR